MRKRDDSLANTYVDPAKSRQKQVTYKTVSLANRTWQYKLKLTGSDIAEFFLIRKEKMKKVLNH